VLQAIGYNTQGKCLYTGLRFQLRCSVRKDTGKTWDFRDPAPVAFLLKLDRKCHEPILIVGILLRKTYLSKSAEALRLTKHYRSMALVISMAMACAPYVGK
jgi:hypothetical protein